MGRDEEHAALIREAISRMTGGSQRLSVAPIGDGIKILSEPPDLVEWLDQDYGIYGSLTEIHSQYNEEIKVIEALLSESVQGGGLQTLKEVLQKVGNDKYARNRAIAGYAKLLWCVHSIPIRLHDGRICVVWPPEDVTQLPIVHEYNPGEFFAAAANTILEMRKALESERKKLGKWKLVGICSLVLLGLGIFFLLR
jgi:hypothetical protein